MHKDGKVVPLAVSAKSAPAAALARLPVVLLQVRDMAALELRLALQSLFDNADDTLFEMADAAATPLDQHLFFEAMRDLRLKRKHIERAFLDIIYEAFSSLGQAVPSGFLASRPLGYDKLARVASDELERSVAVDTMVARVLSRDGVALAQLSQRFDSLVEHPLGDTGNPLGPARLCEYFLQAGRSLGVGIKVKLVLLKLFERFVLREAGSLYYQANQLLVAGGILPGLQPLPGRRARDVAVAERRAPANEPALDEFPADAGAQALFASLQTVLLPVRGQLAPRLEVVAPVQPISTRDLLRLLSHLQQYVPAAGDMQAFDLRLQLGQLLTRVSVQSGKYRKVEGADEDVINLVALLFGFILEDRNLPCSLRLLIGRMQIPMLKVALLDKSFFGRASHPARRLLNEIAAAAMGWGGADDSQRDSLYPRVDKIVQRLLNDFIDDPAIFSELLAEFLAFNSDERRRTELLEQRTRDAEEGRARAALARQQVQDELNRRLLGKYLPVHVLGLVENAWSQVLLMACLKHGQASTQWQAALHTLDTLIWSVEPHDASDRLLLLQRVPSLLKALRDGLAGIAFAPSATREFFARLETLHMEAFGNPGKAGRIEVRTPIVLRGPEQSPESPSVALAEDDPLCQDLQRLRPGAWVEWQDAGVAQRCKLIAVIDSSDTYVFVNRSGVKAREWTRSALLLALQQGELRLLDDALLFDRALNAVVSRLSQGGPRQGHV